MKFLLLLLCVSVVRAGYHPYPYHQGGGLPYYSAPQPVYTRIPVQRSVFTGVPAPQSVYPGFPAPQSVYTGVPAPQSVYTGVPVAKSGYTGIPVAHHSGVGTSTFYGNTPFIGRYQPYSSQSPIQSYSVPVQSTYIPSHNFNIGQSQATIIETEKPAIKTITYELRRPAIQKKFYDIEERVIVRPVGSAVVEFNQPHSKVQKASSITLVPSVPGIQIPVSTQHEIVPPEVNYPQPEQITPPSQLFVSTTTETNTDSVVIEAEQQFSQKSQGQPDESKTPILNVRMQELIPPMSRQLNLFKPEETISRKTSDQSITQQRLIELLTAKDGVADVNFDPKADAGQVRVQVLSANLAPKNVPHVGERLNTRRVVVSRPIETIEEVHVEQPTTHLERKVIPAFLPRISPVPHFPQQPIYYH